MAERTSTFTIALLGTARVKKLILGFDDSEIEVLHSHRDVYQKSRHLCPRRI